MQYSLDVNKMLRGMLLAILTFFVIHLVKSGDINLLVSPIIAKIVNFSVIPFIILTLATLVSSRFIQLQCREPSFNLREENSNIF